MDDKFPERLSAARKAIGITQKGLADQVGVAFTTISSYETGTKEPGLAIASKIAKALSISLDDLCWGTEHNYEPKTYGDVARFIAAWMLAEQPDAKSGVETIKLPLHEHPSWDPDSPAFVPHEFNNYCDTDGQTEYWPTGEEKVDAATITCFHQKLTNFFAKQASMLEKVLDYDFDDDIFLIWQERELGELDKCPLNCSLGNAASTKRVIERVSH